MTILESVKHEIDTLNEDSLLAVRDFVLFQKHRTLLEMSDTEYLNSIPGMAKSIREGIETPLSDCVPLPSGWIDV